MSEKLKKPVEQPAEEQKRAFGDDVMTQLGKIEPLRIGLKAGQSVEPYVREIWESKRKCRDEDGKITSAVRVDIFRHAGMNDRFIVYEVKDGKLLESRFNSLLEPVAGGTSPSSLVEEHRKKLEEFMKCEFFKHAMGAKEELTITKIQGVSGRNRYIRLPKKLVSEMHLKNWDCGRWEQEGESLVWARLKETTIPAKVQATYTAQARVQPHHYFSLIVVIPEEMLVAGGLKLGDYAEWSREGNLLSLRKTEASNPNAMKVQKTGHSIGVVIPKAVAEELKVEKGMYGVLTFDENGLWLKLSKENPLITRIYVTSLYEDNLWTIIPEGLGEHIGKGDVVSLKVEGDRLYIRKKQ